MSTRLFRTLPASVLLLAAALACSNTADGVKQDAEIASEKIAESEVGEAMSGGAKTTDVKTALLADSIVSGTAIDVDTNEDTKTVTLSGVVASDAVRARAEQVAKDNATGYTVVNNLTVRNP